MQAAAVDLLTCQSAMKGTGIYRREGWAGSGALWRLRRLAGRWPRPGLGTYSTQWGSREKLFFNFRKVFALVLDNKFLRQQGVSGVGWSVCTGIVQHEVFILMLWVSSVQRDRQAEHSIVWLLLVAVIIPSTGNPKIWRIGLTERQKSPLKNKDETLQMV